MTVCAYGSPAFRFPQGDAPIYEGDPDTGFD